MNDFAENIRKVVDALPPLTEAQRVKLAALLRQPAGQASVADSVTWRYLQSTGGRTQPGGPGQQLM